MKTEGGSISDPSRNEQGQRGHVNLLRLHPNRILVNFEDYMTLLIQPLPSTCFLFEPKYRAMFSQISDQGAALTEGADTAALISQLAESASGAQGIAFQS